MSETLNATYAEFFVHAFDEKGRITVPSEWRTEDYPKHLIIIPFRREYLSVYPIQWMSKLMAKLESDGVPMNHPKRQAFEQLASNAQNAELDTNGRIIVKERLRKHVGIEKMAVLSGAGNHFKIWSEESFRKNETAEIDLQRAAEVLEL